MHICLSITVLVYHNFLHQWTIFSRFIKSQYHNKCWTDYDWTTTCL